MDTFSLPITVVLLVAREREEEIERARKPRRNVCIELCLLIKAKYSSANCYEAAELRPRLLAALISTSHWFHSRSKLEKHHNDSRNEKGGRKRCETTTRAMRGEEKCVRFNIAIFLPVSFSYFHHLVIFFFFRRHCRSVVIKS